MSDETSDARMERLLRTLPPALRGMGFGDPDDAEYAHASDVVAWAIREIARLREERRWIPVGERLPDLDVEVLVWQQGYTAIGWREHRPWYTVPKTIWTLGDDLDKGYPPEKITHWMPLPAPSSEGEVE